MKSSLLFLSVFFAGGLIAYTGLAPEWMHNEDLSSYTLYLLMLLVGIGIGSDTEMRRIFRQVNAKMILVPLAVILGSLLGATLFSFLLFNISIREAMAVGAGFGYYSLSGILIAEISGEELGVVALLANIFREVLTLTLAPLLVKWFGKYAVIASGGATAMDTTLPVVVRYSGKEMAVVAVFSGLVLSMLVPVLVPFILTVFK
ncbi:lysine exporter LysO family protein [Geofilum sp. OHC36d9]|uniref:lysine exporter LysO family protein n=1 Tax=Geofilum sp. OHC36d9 TaxID=3458413 RepID=UPI0040340211